VILQNEQFFVKPEQAITANLPACRSAQRKGGRGLGYGG